MAKKEKKSLEQVKIDPLHKYLHNKFKGFSDERRDNKSLKLADALMSGYAVFSLKDPSLPTFNNERTARRENLQSVYRIQSAPSDTGMRRILDEVSPEQFKGVYKGVVGKLRSAGILKGYGYFRGHLICSIDGVQHFCSGAVNCEHCQQVTKKNGEVDYRHSMLSGAIVHPDRSEVLPIVHGPVQRQDGVEKNDSGRNAAKRLLPNLRALFPTEPIIVAEGALSADGPHIEALQKDDFRFVINLKPDGNKYIFDLLDRMGKQNKVNTYEVEQDGLLHKFRYVDDVPINSSHRDIRVNVLDYEQIDPKGKKPKRHFSWATDLYLTKKSVEKVMRIGRSRWKIENETFNTLKNQGYHFQHNFGHGKQFLCTVFALLMMSAFMIGQVQQGWNDFFKAAHKKVQTKKALWEKVRQKFNEYVVGSMEMIYKLILDLLAVRYVIIEDSG